MVWGVLILLNLIYYSFITGHIHFQLELGMMEKRAKLLAFFDAIPPRVWVEMAPQILRNHQKYNNRVWGM